MYSLMRHNYETHLLIEGQFECLMYYSNMNLSLRMTIYHTSLRMIFFWPIWKSSWVETLTDGLKLWYPNWTLCTSTKYGLWLKYLCGWPNMLLIGMSIQIIASYSRTLSREFISSGRASPFMDYSRYWGVGISIFDVIVKIFNFIKIWMNCVCARR